MILPHELSISWYYTAIPVFDWEPIPCKPAEGDAAATAPPAPETPDATSTPAQAGDSPAERRRLVLVRYEWRPAMDWEYVMNPEWNRWTERCQDDSNERSRDNERNRNTRARPLPPPPLPAAGAAPAVEPAGPGGNRDTESP
jgi:hypothetical protein